MKPVLSFLLLIGMVTPLVAHPGVGIVQDRYGNIYFTDLKQVWKITPDGSQTVAVAAVHTHELMLDSEDNLYGEHLSFDNATGKWHHRIWRLSPDGALRDIVPTTEGFRKDFGFVRDGKGTMYWAEEGAEMVIKKRRGEGLVATHAAGDLRRVAQMTATENGTLYLMDSGDLRRISPEGEVTTLVSKLSGQDKPPAQVTTPNYHMGLWTDQKEGIYVAVPAERLALRVTADGASTVVARSTAPWSPSGGLVDRDGHLWLLEFDDRDKVRVRRVHKNGGNDEKIFMGGSPRG